MNPRTRSPNYPRHSLPSILEKLQLVWKALQSHAAARDVILDAMGYRSVSGSADKAFSALRQYGLLDPAGKGKYRISELGKTYLHPRSKEEWDQAIKHIAIIPNVFSAIKEEFPGSLPADTLIRNFLIRKGFSEIGAKQALSAFGETIEFVESQVKEPSDPVTDDQILEDPTSVKTNLDPNLSSGKETNNAENQLTVSITPDSRVNVAATKLDLDSVERLIKWLTANKEFVSKTNETENSN